LDPTTLVTLTGAQTLTSKTLTTPIITTSINDTNGNQIVALNPVASAVNEVAIANAATGLAPSITSAGTDANINLALAAKGTGTVSISGIKYPNADGSSGQVISTNGAGTLSFASVALELIGTVQTTTATVTTIAALTTVTTADTAYFLEVRVVGKQTTTGTTAASFIIKATFNNVAGTLSLLGKDLMYTPQGTTWLADVAVSGTSIVVNVTGAASTTINWRGTITVLSAP
jgi:hypothetical protein